MKLLNYIIVSKFLLLVLICKHDTSKTKHHAMKACRMCAGDGSHIKKCSIS